MNLIRSFLGCVKSIAFVLVALGVSACAFAAQPTAKTAGSEANSGMTICSRITKVWDMMPFFPGEVGWGDAPMTGEPQLKAGGGPALRNPKDDPKLWGKWKFWNGQWWAGAMLLPESAGPSWDAPSGGLAHPWNQYRNLWLKARHAIPGQWKGCRVMYSQEDFHDADLLLFVNRRYAGVIRCPAGRVDVSSLLQYGVENEFLVLMTADGYQLPDAKDSARGGYRAGSGTQNFRFTKDPPQLIVSPAVCIEDVFANTSWRKRTLTVETEITVPRAGKVEVTGEVVNASGKVVKRVTGKYDVPEGTSVVKPSADWKDPITWELGRGYLYTLKTSIRYDGKRYGYRDVRFGFREIWREDRKIFMNGHEQKFRVTYNFGCNRFGARFLSGIGFNCIQYAHRTEQDPRLDEGDLAYLSEHGIACIVPTTAFDWNTKNPLISSADKRADFKRIQASNLRRYRNYPCIAMCYMGTNAYLPQWAYEAIHLGSGDGSPFSKMLADMIAQARETNPNILYFSHSDGNTGDIASANLYLNWVPLQEREEWPSRWAVRGHFPFQACEFGHPYEYSWYKGGRDLITEYCAAYYGEDVYLKEPRTIQERHIQSLYKRRFQHPYFWKLTEDFYWRTTRAWRTFGVNAGIVWFNLDYGFGMPGWKLETLWNQYNPCYNDAAFKTDADLPKGRPDWAFPSWDIYRKGNLDFLGWIAGHPRITDRTHAFRPGETVRKQCVMLWDGFSTRRFTASWKALLGDDEIASGKVSHDLQSNRPFFAPIAFAVPKSTKRKSGEIVCTFRDAEGKPVFEDRCAFEVVGESAGDWKKAPRFALYDPDGKTEPELRKLGLVNFRTVSSLDGEFNGVKHLVVGSFALGKTGWKELPMTEVANGLHVLVLPQNTAALAGFGLNLQDRFSRVMFLRDTSNPCWKGIDDDLLREWAGAPRVQQKDAWGLQQYGSLVRHHKHEPRWTYNMAVASLQFRSPDCVGWIPQVEGECDMNYSTLATFGYGNGSVRFCTLDFLGRFSTGAKEDDVATPVADAAATEVGKAVFRDFLTGKSVAATRPVVPSGSHAGRIAATVGAVVSSERKLNAEDLLLVGNDSTLTAEGIVKAAELGANVLVVANDGIAKGLGFTVAKSGPDVYFVRFDHANPDLRGIGQSQLRWRERMTYSVLGRAPDGWRIDAEGMFASKTFPNGAKVFVSSYDPYFIENKLATDTFYLVNGKQESRPEKRRNDDRRRGDISIERSYQFTARLLTNLGAKSDFDALKYTGLSDNFDPYEFTYW